MKTNDLIKRSHSGKKDLWHSVNLLKRLVAYLACPDWSRKLF